MRVRVRSPHLPPLVYCLCFRQRPVEEEVGAVCVLAQGLDSVPF